MRPSRARSTLGGMVKLISLAATFALAVAFVTAGWKWDRAARAGDGATATVVADSGSTVTLKGKSGSTLTLDPSTGDTVLVVDGADGNTTLLYGDGTSQPLGWSWND